MKTYFISWEIRPSVDEIAYSNTVTEQEDDVKPLKVYERALDYLTKHYGVGREKVTARAFNEI